MNAGDRQVLWKQWPWLVLLGFVAAAVFAEPLLSPTPLFLRDLGLWHYPVLFSVHANATVAWDPVPGWTSSLGMGRPLLANSAYALMCPLNVLYAVLPIARAFNLFIVLHVFLAGLGMLVLAWKIGLRGAEAWIAATAYMLGGFVVSCSLQYPMISPVAWAPFVLAAALKVASDSKPKWVAVLAVVVGLQFIGGQPEPAAMTFAVAFFWSVASAPSVMRVKVALACVIAGVWGALLAAPQLLTTAEYAGHSVRSLGLSSETVLYWSLHPQRLAELLWPRIGNWLVIGSPLNPLVDGGRPLFNSVYLGLSTVFLAGGGLALTARFSRSGRQKAELSTAVLVVTLLAGVVFSMGRYIPGVSVAIDHAGGLVPFRFPVKALMLAALTAPLLAGRGLHVLLESVQPRFRVAVSLIAAAVVLMDLSVAHNGMTPVTTDPPESIDRPLARYLKSASRELGADDEQWRIYHHRLPQRGWGPGPRAGQPVDAELYLLWRQRFLEPQTGLLADLAHAFEPSVEILDAVAMHAIAVSLHRSSIEMFTGALGEAGVLWMISPRADLEQASGGKLVLITELGPQFGLPPRSGMLYRVTSYLPRARLVTDFVVDAGVTVSEVVARHAIGSELPPIVLANGPGIAADRNPNSAGSVVIVSDFGDSVLMEAECDRPCVLMMADLLLPGWRASVDGVPIEILLANKAFRAIPLEAGRHRVEMSYQPPGLIAGLLLSAGALMAVVVTIVLPSRRVSPIPVDRRTAR